MVMIEKIKIVEEEWDEQHPPSFWHEADTQAFAKIGIDSTGVDEDLQDGTICFFFKGDPEKTLCGADICTHESVWSCEFEDWPDDFDDDKGVASAWERFGVDKEILARALLQFGESVMGMYT